MRGHPLYLITLVMVLLAVAPAGALAAEEPAPTAPEAPAPEATPPPSTGWVPQAPAAEGADNANAPTQRGSSLGSGGSSDPAPSTSAPPASPEPSSPAPAPTDSYYEPETSAPPSSEESASAPATETAPAPVEPPVAKVEPDPSVPPAVGSASQVARSASSGEADGASKAAAAAEQVASTVTDESGGLPWLALILCGLVLVYAGVRVLLGPVEPAFFRSDRFRFVRRVFPGA